MSRVHTAEATPVGVRTVRLAPARLPLHFFAVATVFFGIGVSALPWIAPDVVQFFYQPLPLALVHTFTLGWITATIMGVMYRYVPALTRTPLKFPRLAYLQLLLFVIGASGMVAHFAIGIWLGTWLAATVMLLSILMFAADMIPCLAPNAASGVAEAGMLMAIGFLVLAALVGLSLALDKTLNFLHGSLLTNLAGHAHLAALGWVTLTICAVSYRMIPAFLLPTIRLPRSAAWQLYGLAIGVIGLVVTLFAEFPGVTWWSAIIAASLLSYLITIGRLVWSRRMPIDWTVRHAIVAMAWLVLAAVLGIETSFLGAGSLAGSRVTTAYGALGLLGWIGNFIIGMSYQLFPGFVGRSRTTVGWPALTIAELSLPRPRPVVFALYNVGLAALAIGFLLGSPREARAAGCLIATGGLLYAAVTLWTLSWTYRSSVPRSALTNPLRILPG
jgi:cbb3-type cytochrome oxidase subunit 1